MNLFTPNRKIALSALIDKIPKPETISRYSAQIVPVLLIGLLAFDLLWTFSLFSFKEIVNSREVWLLEVADSIQRTWLPKMRGVDSAYYPRSPLFNYLLAVLESITGRDPVWLRALPAFFYYGIAVLIYRFLNKGWYGLFGVATFLILEEPYYQIIGKPFTASAFFYFLICYLAGLLLSATEREQKDRYRNGIILSLILFSLTYEGVILAVGMLGLLLFYNLGWKALNELKIIIGVMIAVALIGAQTGLYLVSNAIGVTDRFDADFLSSLMFSDTFHRVFRVLFDRNYLGVIPIGLAVALFTVSLVYLFFKNPAGKLSFFISLYGISLVLCLLYGIMNLNRLLSPYLLHLLPLWIILIWESVRTLPEWFIFDWDKRKILYYSCSIFVFYSMSSFIDTYVVNKKLTLRNFVHVSAIKSKWIESKTPTDWVFTTDPNRLTGYIDDGDRARLVHNFKLGSDNNSALTQNQLANRNTSRQCLDKIYGYRVPCDSFDDWQDTLKKAVLSEDKVWLSYLKPLPPEITNSYVAEFAIDLYETITFYTQSDLSGASQSLPIPGALDTLVTVEVDFLDSPGSYVQYPGTYGDVPSENMRWAWLNPGRNTLSLYFKKMPEYLFLSAQNELGDLIEIRSIEVAYFKIPYIRALEGSMIGRGVLYLLEPFYDKRKEPRPEHILKGPVSGNMTFFYVINSKHPGPAL